MSDEDVINPKECMILNAIHQETKKRYCFFFLLTGTKMM
jgi:hypothetical protein